MKLYKKIIIFLFLFTFVVASESFAAPKPSKKPIYTGSSLVLKNGVIPKFKPSSSIVAKPDTDIKPVKKPSTSTQPKYSNITTQNSQSQDVKRPLISANLVTKDPNIKTRTLSVSMKKNFSDLLSDLGFRKTQIISISARLKSEGGFDISKAKIGQKLIATEKIEKNRRKVLALQIPLKNEVIMISKKKEGGVQITKNKQEANPISGKRYFYKEGRIKTSLRALGIELGVPSAVTNKAGRVLGAKVDMRSIQKGDKVEMLYEYSYENGKQTGLRLLHVVFISKRQRIEGFRFSVDGVDRGEFYDVNGNSFAKSFLSQPLRGKYRISSKFGYRTHPILKKRLLHTGVDFAARSGTPIYAAGHGTIVKIQRLGGYGKYIKIQHDKTWSTAYAHLRSYAKGMRKWKRVRKGQLIGYVGSTGRSTGPHLHFELIKNGKAIDPLRSKLPSGGKKLTGKDKTNLRKQINSTKKLLSKYRR